MRRGFAVPPAIAEAVNRLVRLTRTWAPAGKAAALFVLPLPLALAVPASLVAGDLPAFALTGSALGALWVAGLIAWRALVAEAQLTLGQLAEPPAIPLKRLSATLTASGAALAALAADHTITLALVFAALGGAGHVLFFGTDRRRRRITVASIEGVDSGAVRRQLEEAYDRIRQIESAARRIETPEFRGRLARITSLGRAVLDGIERDPGAMARARRFLHLYLESAERVVLDYVGNHRRVSPPPQDRKFQQLLIAIERTFAEQQKRLAERNSLSLDVEIEVFASRLAQEASSLENRP